MVYDLNKFIVVYCRGANYNVERVSTIKYTLYDSNKLILEL